MTKTEREEREYRSLFKDERFAKKAWKEFIGDSLQGTGKQLPMQIDPKTGEPTFTSLLDQTAYLSVKDRLRERGIDREPMQAELIVECNVLRARFNDTTFNTILERTAGKVKEEISVQQNEFESLTDEELELLAKYREEHDNAPTEE